MYTYEVSTTDEKHFTCTRKEEAQEHEWNAPLETMRVVLGEMPNMAVWGKSLAALYLDLLQQITERLSREKGQ